jgi:uncharacterized protein GlcG (DUF336 family)
MKREGSMYTRRVIMGLALTLAAVSSAEAQQASLPPGSPLLRPPAQTQIPGPYGAPVTVDYAQRLIAAAMAEARRRNYQMAFAVVDPAGELVAFARLDEVQTASIVTAQDKAKCAARYRRPTLYWAQQIAMGNINVTTLEGLLAAEGGVPLVDAHGHVIGAIGVSGGTSAQDGDTAAAAIAAVH